jgi:hypothetical protein
MTDLFEHLIDGILERGYGVADAFLTEAETAALRRQMQQRHE